MNKFSILLATVCCLFLTSCRPAAQHRLQATIDSFNSTCPFRMTEDIWIDSLHYDRTEKTVSYCCTYAGLPYVDVTNAEMMDVLTQYTALESKRSFDAMRSNPNGKETLMLIRQADATLTFDYHLANGTQLATHTFPIDKATFDLE